jgi:hypothetical protein
MKVAEIATPPSLLYPPHSSAGILCKKRMIVTYITNMSMNACGFKWNYDEEEERRAREDTLVYQHKLNALAAEVYEIAKSKGWGMKRSRLVI